eukprot:1736397-Alexandrium_andersonii.AAC.1
MGGVFGEELPAAGAAPGELPVPAGPEVAPPAINLKDEDLPSEDFDGQPVHGMAEAVPGTPSGDGGDEE